MDYLFTIATFILIYFILVQSLNLILGYGGLLSVCHGVFAAIGAYTAAIMSANLGYGFVAGTLAGFVIAALFGALIAIPSLRIRGDYIMLFTLGVQQVGLGLITVSPLTGRGTGIVGIPRPTILGLTVESPLENLLLMLLVSGLCLAICWRLANSPFARALKAIREDETAARSLGKRTFLLKVWIFSLGGAIGAVGGSALAVYLSLATPDSYTLHLSILLTVIVVLGGLANFWGSLVGVVILIGLPELLRFVPGAQAYVDAIRRALYGVMIVLFMLFRPEGMLPEHIGQARKARKRRESTEAAEESLPWVVDRAASSGGTADDEAILEIKGMSRSFGGLRAVDEASLILPRGKITGLLGPNGCGKSTLFNLVTGFLSPDRGTVRLQGKDVTGYSPERLVRAGLVRSWQDTRVFQGMTALDNVMVAFPDQSGESVPRLFCRPAAVARDEKANRRKAMAYLRLVGIGDKADRVAADLSAAEQKLLALARVVATGSPLLMLDEPTAALDPDSVERVGKLIQRIAREGRKTVCLVEHNMDVIRAVAEGIYFMNEGRIQVYGTPHEIMNDPKLTEAYFAT
jgi:branched-chain amino acid transport system ATP-binding protein/branched-chain amino acid transport system permease protein